MTTYIDDQKESMQSLANHAKFKMLDEEYQLYISASESNNFDAKIKSLTNLAQHFVDMRGSDSDIFISPQIFNEPTQTYLLQKVGTNMCFGPRNQSNIPMCKIHYSY